uniref:SH3 domain-containing protein n=1 Tax=Junco hyemalis TaxID=40217 RepID=A0A8C5IUG9_JUNHY
STEEEEFSAEVESWMTGEQYAAWILSARGCDKNTRGWSVSMFTGNTWQDLLGCDFVLDLIGEMEDTSNFISSSQAPTEYPITPERDRILQGFPAYSLPLLSSDTHLNVFPSGKSVPLGSDNCFGFILMQDMENSENLTRRMKGGGKIGPTQRGIFPSTGLSGMTQTPVYQPMPSMVGMPAAMPMMPGVGGVAPMPAMVMPQPMVPAVDPSQLAAQQQAFINQQAMLMVSEGPQGLGKSHTGVCAWRGSPALLVGPALCHSGSSSPFYAGEQRIRVKKVRPSKTWTPPAKPQPTEEEEEEKREEMEKRKKEEMEKRKKEELEKRKEEKPPKPKKETPKPKKEPPVVKPSGPEKRPAPSHEIGNIIKMYQSRPAPEPQPIQPTQQCRERTAQRGFFVLQPSPVPQEKKIPPPVKPKPGPASSSIKEKQLPLLSIFKPEGAPPAAQAPYAPPLPPATPEDQGRQEPPGKDELTPPGSRAYELQNIPRSYLCNICNTTIALLLQVFYPKENFSHPYCLNLLCEQVSTGVWLKASCLSGDKTLHNYIGLLGKNPREEGDLSIQEEGIKKRIVVAARDNWANYFSRLFPVQGEKGSDVQLLGVSHRGMRLLKVEKAAGYHPEHLKILRSYCFAEVLSVEMKGSNSLEFSLKTEQLILHSPKAPCIKDMVELFMQELRQDTNYVVALRSYIVDDKSLLSFNKGDLIELLPMQGVEPGWQFGSMGGRCGLFPTSLVQLAPAIDYLSSSMDRRGEQRKGTRAPPESRNTSREVSSPWGETPRAHGWVQRGCHGSGSV